MHRMASGLALIALCISASAEQVPDKAIEAASQKAIEKLDKAVLGDDVKSVAVLPLWGDKDGYAADMIKAALTQKGIQVLVRSDEEWKLLLDEIEWNAKREDVMDAATIQHFGKIRGCDGILYGTVREVAENVQGMRGYVKLSLHIADVETGRIVWSSGPVEGEGYAHWTDVVGRVWGNTYFWIGLGVIVVVIAALVILKRASQPR